MKKNILLLFITVWVLHAAEAQPIFNFGPELGLSISQLPEKDNYISKSGNDNVKSHTNPLFGTLAGVHAQLILKKIFLFTTGLQYEMAGSRYTFHNDGFNPMHNLNFTADIKENQTFQKICLPLSAGITFPLFKVHLSIYCGYRANYFIDGIYYNKTEIVYPENHDYDETTVVDINPLKKSECYEGEHMNPLNNQVFFGISVSKKRLEFALNGNIGLINTYVYDIEHSVDYKNNDFSFAVRYRFFGFKKQNKQCNMFALSPVFKSSTQ